MRTTIKNAIAKARALEEAAIHVKKGAFHAWLGKSPDEPITKADIAKGKAAGGHAAKMAIFAQNFGHIGESLDESLDEGSNNEGYSVLRTHRTDRSRAGIEEGTLPPKHTFKVGDKVKVRGQEDDPAKMRVVYVDGHTIHVSNNLGRVSQYHHSELIKSHMVEETLEEGLRKVSEHEYRGRKAVVYRNPEYDEYQVKFHHNGQHLKDADSFHSDKEDAQGTARHWIAHAHPEGTNEETIDEAHKVLDVSKDEYGNRFELHAHNYGHPTEWHGIKKTHQHGEKLTGGSVTHLGKPKYVAKKWKELKARHVNPNISYPGVPKMGQVKEETLDEVVYDFDHYLDWENAMKKHGAHKFKEHKFAGMGHSADSVTAHDKHDRHIGTWKHGHNMGWLHHDLHEGVLDEADHNPHDVAGAKKAAKMKRAERLHKKSMKEETLNEVEVTTMAHDHKKWLKDGKAHGVTKVVRKGNLSYAHKPDLYSGHGKGTKVIGIYNHEDDMGHHVDDGVHEETISELSKKTLGHYIKKAAGGLNGAAWHAYHYGAGNQAASTHWKKAVKRLHGIEKATDKLTKEETLLSQKLKTKLGI